MLHKEKNSIGCQIWVSEMNSESSKTWNQVRLLHAATEGLKKDGGVSSEPKEEEGAEEEKTEATSASSSEEEQSDGDTEQEESPSPARKEVDEGRLAQLRSHLQSQFSIHKEPDDPNSSKHLMELVGKIIRGKGVGGSSSANSVAGSGGQCPTCGQCSNPAGCSNGFPAEVEKTLQRELAVLKGEVTASIESMRREVAEELGSLREALQAYKDHHFFQNSELSPLEELDENIPEQLKGRGLLEDKLGGKITSEERFKSRSVPTLHPLPISGRSQAIMRAMSTTISARNSFISSLSRSHSDPVEPMQLPPTIPKIATRKQPAKPLPPPATRTYASCAKSGSKIAARATAPHPSAGNGSVKPY